MTSIMFRPQCINAFRPEELYHRWIRWWSVVSITDADLVSTIKTSWNAYQLTFIRSYHHSDVIMSAVTSQIRRRSKKTSKLLVNGLCEGNSPMIGGFPTGPVTRKMFQFDDVSMWNSHSEKYLFDIVSDCRPFCSCLNTTFPIPARWKLHSTPIQVLAKWLLWNFAYGATAILGWPHKRPVKRKHLPN